MFAKGINMHSEYDSKGLLNVACSECERGGNGSDPNKCSCGWKVKKYNKMGCFAGTLMAKYQELMRKNISTSKGKT
jgi:hypothetical protein